MFCSIEMNYPFFLTFYPDVPSLLKTVYFKLNLEVITQDSDQLLLISKPVQSCFQHRETKLSCAFPNMKVK